MWDEDSYKTDIALMKPRSPSRFNELSDLTDFLKNLGFCKRF